LNRSLSEKLKTAFPDVVPVTRLIIKDQKIKNPGASSWLAGFAAAEGYFKVSIYKSKDYKLGFQVQLCFILTQDGRDEKLLRSFIKYLECGEVYQNRTWCDFKVTKLSDIIKKIIPLFKNYPTQGDKAKNFEDFCKVAELIKQKKDLMADGLEQIRIIKAGMNRGRN